MKPIYKYNWKLSTAKFSGNRGKVFSCFAGVGGSTMGYKLAGFDVIGCLEIDKRMNDVYKKNLNPQFNFVESIQTFKDKRNDELPNELFELDILDGSPPCSAFSVSGERDKNWGKKKKFKEGQSEQVLDTLVFDFIDLAEKLQPKICVVENVKGLLIGKAQQYVIDIYRAFDKAGYHLQHFLLDSQYMGVPQYRERVFFIALRKDLCKQFMHQRDLFTYVPKLSLYYDCKPIPYDAIDIGEYGRKLEPSIQPYFEIVKHGQNIGNYLRSKKMKVKFFNYNKVNPSAPLYTITAGSNGTFRHDAPYYICDRDLILCQSFPRDFNFGKLKIKYALGMSVPPVMMAHIANDIFKQWISKF